MTRPFRLTSLAVAALLTLAGCRTSDLEFRSATGFRVLAPGENSAVSFPFRLSWTDNPIHGRFAVFFDRSPIAPGQTLLSLVPKLDPCRAQSVCPDGKWLGDRDIYLTSSTSVMVRTLLDLTSGKRSTEEHEVTIIVVDSQGRRLGESAAIRTFRVLRGVS